MTTQLTSLRSKLYLIVASSFVFRIIAFFMLPNSPSAFGPDEGTYSEVAEWTALGKSAAEFPLYGSGLYLSGRSLLLPAAILNKIGFSPLDAVRLIASLYGFLTLILVTTLILKLAGRHSSVELFAQQKPKQFFGLFLTFTFLPGHFLWSVLGLRESAIEFWTISVFVLLFMIFQWVKNNSILSYVAYLISITMVFSARPQVGWVLGFTLLIYLLVKIRERVARILLPLTAIGILLGYSATVAMSLEVNTSYLARQESAAPTSVPSVKVTSKAPDKKVPKPSRGEQETSSPTSASSPTSMGELTASKFCKSANQEIVVEGVKYLCEVKTEKKTIRDLKNPGDVIISQADDIPYKHEVNKLGAASAIKTQACPFVDDSRIDRYLCIAYRAPYTTYTFLFRPMLGNDVTTLASLFAAIENTLWLASFVFIAIMLIRNRRLTFLSALAPSLLFMAIYCIAAGAYEGNMGTAFRHKSMILWVVILLLMSTMVATKERKAESKELTG